MRMNAQGLTMGDKKIAALQKSVIVTEKTTDVLTLHYMLSN